MHWLALGASILAMTGTTTYASRCPVKVSQKWPLTFETGSWNGKGTVQNTVLTGSQNETVSAISITGNGHIMQDGGSISWNCISPTVMQIKIDSSKQFVGAKFINDATDLFYGVWEYPLSDTIVNSNVSFELKGFGNSEGINWSNARAPFFISTAGYGVYADSTAMSSYEFTAPGTAEFIFNTSSLTYYIITPEKKNDYKAIIEEYTGLSARSIMPPDSAYGPNFYSDDFEEDFHGYVHNAQENYYDVVDHLYYHQIHASGLFADRPYGTGNSSFGNFDFDPKYYPTPEQFIQNLTDYGFDFQVWVANRAFLDTELYNASVENGWLFPGINPEQFLGPALNLSIPAAYEYFKERLSYFPSIGVKGYKIDRGEEGEMPVSEQNIQDVLFRRLCYETMVEKWGEDGFHDFARSAYDRDRAVTTVWDGDAHSNFTGLRYTVADGIRAGLIGFSHWTSDTGGYVREGDEPTEELWARWMHHSAFTPEFLIMIGTGHTPWYAPYTDRLVSILKQTANLHHDLIPFIKSYTYQATQNGVPIMRALFLESPEDDKAYTISDEYFFGEEFLVAPIVNEGGSRTVYFPKGADYLEYYNKTNVYKGGSTAYVQLELEYSPVYIKAGSIIPRGDIVQANNKWTKNWAPHLTVEAYPSFDVESSTFTYYNGVSKKSVPITMISDKKQSSVKIIYGDMGVGGTLILFTKKGELKAPLAATGGMTEFKNVESLFS
ncbi:CAZyme family GH31 [Paecilomyces variotii]|nr:CAZyme family GH31 [Paecilomyces variotii]KAJ9357905.1 CAZyme family GH31 [Paecilomyces variotii]KAJ9387693.1 CAZyme family GH31 [Paecilomyces variotii]